MRIGNANSYLMMCAVPILVMAQDVPTGQQEEAAAQEDSTAQPEQETPAEAEETPAEAEETPAEAEETPAEEETATLNSGDTAWMLIATALVLFMTIPGLALFYGGLVRVQNVLSVLMQCFALTGIITIL